MIDFSQHKCCGSLNGQVVIMGCITYALPTLTNHERLPLVGGTFPFRSEHQPPFKTFNGKQMNHEATRLTEAQCVEQVGTV